MEVRPCGKIGNCSCGMAPVSPLAPHGATTRIGKSGSGHFPRQPKIPGRDQEFGGYPTARLLPSVAALGLDGTRLRWQRGPEMREWQAWSVEGLRPWNNKKTPR